MERTKKYFNQTKEDIGFLGMNNGWEGIEEILKKNNYFEGSEFKKVTSYKGFINSGDIDIYSYKKDGELRYCSELGYAVGIDDYNVETMIFNKLPSREDVMRIIDIKDLEMKFEFKDLSPTFKCWECRKETHWLDIEGNFDKKMSCLLDTYCGC